MIGKSSQLPVLELIPQVDEPNTTTIVKVWWSWGRPRHYALAGTKSEVTLKHTKSEEKDRAVVYPMGFEVT